MTAFRLAPATERQLHASSLANQLLANRGFTTADEVAAFLTPDYDRDRHDPLLMPGMEAAVERIQTALSKGERIAVYADYDCDGIPGAVVLTDFLKAVGHTNYVTYIPHRHFEGFGLNSEAVEKLHKDTVTLIITIDCGVSDHSAAERASELGVDVIITDHHEPKETLPTAVAVVNPKLPGEYPFKELCGAGVVFKLVEALIATGDYTLSADQAKWFLDMVGLATINDMVPLHGENRVFAHYGLTVLRKSRRPGLQHLLRTARAKQAFLTEDDVGFTIGPRVNAASRMDTPEDAFTMLATQDESEAGTVVAHLENLNNERKGLVAAITKELHKRIKAFEDIPPVIVMGNPKWRPALVGLAATKLAEEYHRPVFLWGRDGNGVVKGSCRSEGVTSIVSLMEAVHEQFSEYGGHHFSGGFSVKEDALFTFADALTDAFQRLGNELQHPEVPLVDAELTLKDVTDGLVKELRLLAPYGVGNPKPLFLFSAVTPAAVNQFGKSKEHLKLVFDREGGALEAIAFFASPLSYKVEPKVGESLSSRSRGRIIFYGSPADSVTHR
ncbi:MAG: single-stranded-DNA-specific exonuclease RecJ [Candidatus Paceibacterota bacterium]